MFRVVVLILLVTLIPNPLHADDKALEILEKAIDATQEKKENSRSLTWQSSVRKVSYLPRRAKWQRPGKS